MKTNITILVSVLLFIQAVQTEAQVSRPDYQNIILQEINNPRKGKGVPPIEKIPRYQAEADAAVTILYWDWLWLDSIGDEDYERVHNMIAYSPEAMSGTRIVSSIILYGWDEADFMVDIKDVFGGPESTVISYDVGFAAISVLEDEDTGELYGVVLTYEAINPSIPRPELRDVVIKAINSARSRCGINPVGEISRLRKQSDTAAEILYREFSLIDSLCDDDYIKVHNMIEPVLGDEPHSKLLSWTILYSVDKDDFVPMLRRYLLGGESLNLNPDGRFVVASVLEDSVSGELYVALLLYK